MAKATRVRPISSAAVQTPLETYLREINETALLTAREEKELSNRISNGEKEARDRMVRANLRLVVNIARAYTGKGLPLQDLIEEGNLGLLRAVEGFDPDMNTRFSTYASYWIKQSIKRALINSAKTIRIPAYMVELLTKWRRATAVAFGLRVTVADDTGVETTYEITGEDEADAALGRIAPHSPLARALLGAEPGDSVTVRRPSGAVTVEILAITRP